MLTVNGAAYKDVSMQDFNHYFASTAMAWKLSPTKRRLFLVNSVGSSNTISGTYLTREKQFKDKNIAWKDWWLALDPIVLQPLMFNLKNGCAIWRHPLAKNLRKSFPWQVNCLRFFGKVEPNDKTMQAIASVAFSELYGNPKIFPTTRAALQQDVPAQVTAEKFLLDRNNSLLYYYSRAIGAVKEDKITLPAKNLAFKSLLMRYAVPPSQIEIVGNPVVQKVEEVLAENHMKHNKHYVAGYEPLRWPLDPWYSVQCLQQGHPEFGMSRTYKGKYPGPGNLLQGWVTYNYGNQIPA